MTSKRRPQWSQDLRVLEVEENHKFTFRQVAISPNGLLLTSTEIDKTIRIWDCASGAELTWIHSHSYYLTFSSDGLRILSLSAESDDLETWDVISGNKINTLHLHFDGIESGVIKESLCWTVSPTDNQVAISVKRGELYIFSMDGTRTQLQGHSKAVCAVAFSEDDSRIVTGSDDRSVRVWNIDSLRCVATTYVDRGHEITQVCITPDGLRVVALVEKSQESRRLWIWDVGSTRGPVSTMKLPRSLWTIPLSVSNITLICSLDTSGALFTAGITSGRRLSRIQRTWTRSDSYRFLNRWAIRHLELCRSHHSYLGHAIRGHRYTFIRRTRGGHLRYGNF